MHNTTNPTTPALRLLFWETTAACNLACVHCRRLDVTENLGHGDLTTAEAKAMIASLPETGRPILVFSGGEPLMRPDIFELAEYARDCGLPTALATNGTLINEEMAKRIQAAGFRRVSMSFDGPDAATHDGFRKIDGAFQASVDAFRLLRQVGVSVQVNTTIARHNYAQLDDIYRLAIELGADALHLFMLVPVGCGMELSEEIMLKPAEYENALNWIYERSLEGKLHLKATCAPHYFRVMNQRGRAEKRPMPLSAHPHKSLHPSQMPVVNLAGAAGGKPGHPGGGHPGGDGDMSAMTKGCLAGQAVCFVSHDGEVFPCGYLPVSSGNVRKTSLPAIWRDSQIFADLRDDSKLEGKCGVCEYRRQCMGCRARAYAETQSYLAEEPNCSHTPPRARAK